MVPTASDVAAAAKQAEQLKQEGNFCFKKERFGAAIDAYTEAITLCPNVPIYWTNRALCHRRKNDWKRVEEDCRRAIELDHYSFKAHYMLGLALLERQAYAEGVKELEKEIWLELAKAKYLEWEHESSKRSSELQKLKETIEIALIERHFLDGSQVDDEVSGENTKSVSEQVEYLDWVFRKAAEDDTPAEVPDYLCCKITLDIFRDPVITPSGLTYERAKIIDHLQKLGNFDPITREPLYQHQLVPNLAIKEAVKAFLDKHGWAYQMN